VKLVECQRCHVKWKEGDLEPRVVVAKFDVDESTAEGDMP